MGPAVNEKHPPYVMSAPLSELRRYVNYRVYICGERGTGLFPNGLANLEALEIVTISDVRAQRKTELAKLLRPFVIEGLETMMRIYHLPENW